MLQEPWQGHCHKHQGWNPAGHFHGSQRRLSIQTNYSSSVTDVQRQDMCQKPAYVADSLTKTLSTKIVLNL